MKFRGRCFLVFRIKYWASLGRRVMLLSTVLVAAVLAPAPGRAALPKAAVHSHAGGVLNQIAQDEPEDEPAIPSDDIQKYIAVYTAMQRDHSLTVEQAAGKQGLSVSQFRDLENKIEESPVAHERVMDALQAAAKGVKNPTPSTE